MMMLKILKQTIKNNIWKMKLFMIIESAAFFAPIAVLFWQENGLSLTEIMLLQSFFAIMMVLFEVPSGYFADVFGRRKTLIISSFFFVFAITTYSLGYSFTAFAVAELLWAVAFAFISGTNSALVYDSLLELKEEKEYKKIWGDISFYAFISVGGASVIGGWLGNFDFRYPFYVMIFTLFFLIPLAFSFQEPKKHKTIVKKGYALELLQIIKKIFTDDQKLRWIIIYSAVILIFNQSVVWLYQPYMQLAELPIIYFGVAFASYQIVAAFASKYAHQIEEKIGLKNILIIFPLLVAGGYFLMGNFVVIFGFAFGFLHQIVRGIKGPVITNYINERTPSEIRATVLSAEGVIGRLGYAMLIPLAGWVADVYTLQQALNILGVTSLIISGIILFFLHQKKVI